VEEEYNAKYRRLLATEPENTPNINFTSSAMASRSGQSSGDPYDRSSDNNEYYIPDNVAETTPG